MTSNATPVLAVDEKNLVPVSVHLKQMTDIPPSRMFLINKSPKLTPARCRELINEASCNRAS